MDRLESTEREFASEVNVSHLFRNKYQHIKLTHNRLHPTNYVCEYIANRILSQLGIFANVNTPPIEFWSHDAMPILPAIRNSLDMDIIDHEEFYYQKGILKRADDYIQHLYWFYSTHHPVVHEAIRMNENKLTTMSAIIKNDYSRVNLQSLFTW